MRGWIFNASPVILLGKIGRLELIPALSPGFRIPRLVVSEIGAGGQGDPATVWFGTPVVSSHIVETPETPPLLAQWNLESGSWRNRRAQPGS